MNNVSQLLYNNGVDNSTKVLSVIIPTFNRIDTLKETIYSIKPNNKFTYEIIIVDNSNIEDIQQTLEFVKSIKNLNLRYYINVKNLGMVGNWNAGLSIANGEFVSFVHDDDVLDDSYFDVIDRIINYKIKDRDRIGFIKARFDYFSEISEVKYLREPLYTYTKMYKIESLVNGVGPTGPPTCGIIFNRKALAEIGGFDENLYPCADHIIGFKLFEKGYFGYYTDDIIGHYRWGVNESMKKSTLIDTVDINAEIRKYFYNSNSFYKMFGVLLKKTQYTRDVLSYLDHAKRFKVEMRDSEMIKRPNLYIRNKHIYYVSNTILTIISMIIRVYKKIVNKLCI